MAEIGTDIHKAKKLLDAGELVAIPTETVYGLAGCGTNDEAILKIFAAKNRPSFDPLIAHTNSLDKIATFVQEIPKQAHLLAKEFWPGPMTILLPKKEEIPDVMTSGLSRVAVRIPNHPLTLELLALLPYPVAAPSANPFGYVSPTTAWHVDGKLGDKIPYILDGGRCNVGVESTIVGFENDQPVIYRLGGLKVEDIEEVCGPVQVKTNQSSNPQAPGMVKSHYAPTKSIKITDLEKELFSEKIDKSKIGVISFKHDFKMPHQYVLSSNGDLEEAAFHLFTALRYFDDLPVDYIIAENVPEIGLGKAINDRLKRAAAK